MAQPDTKLVTPLSLVVDFVLVAAFFAYLFTLLRSHVPSNDPKMINLWGAIGSSCLTAVFWLCIQMFRAVLRKQRASKKH
jgi:RsiW-degrading membrane proteinase PrsW (M82 family)